MPRNKSIIKFAKENGIDEDVAREAILSFFSYFRNCMKMPTLPDIRLKGLGVFKPAISRLKQTLNSVEARKAKGLISEEVYEKKKNLINDYLKNEKF